MEKPGNQETFQCSEHWIFSLIWSLRQTISRQTRWSTRIAHEANSECHLKFPIIDILVSKFIALTYRHPDSISNPGVTSELHHQIHIHKDAHNRKQRQEGDLGGRHSEDNSVWCAKHNRSVPGRYSEQQVRQLEKQSSSGDYQKYQNGPVGGEVSAHKPGGCTHIWPV